MKLRAVLVLVAVCACRGGESEDPPVHLIHNMDTQEKGRPYRKDTSGLFPNGRFMQMPIEGTVAQGQLNDDSMFDDGIDPDPTTLDGGKLGHPATTFKFPPQAQLPDGGIDEAFVERGHLRFNIYCAPCHGVTGDGKGLVAQKAFDGGMRLEVPPRDLTSAAAKDYPVGQIYSAIKNGVNAGNMASYATQVPVMDRWAISAYVLRMQGRTFDGKPPEPPPDMNGPASIAIGKYLYKARGCNACHSLDGSKIVGPSWVGIWGKVEKTSAGDVTIDATYIEESGLEPKAKVVDGFQPVMPPPTAPFTEKELDSIVLFIQSLKG
jgi:mono/diheme cytochrome c family protein